MKSCLINIILLCFLLTLEDSWAKEETCPSTECPEGTEVIARKKETSNSEESINIHLVCKNGQGKVLHTCEGKEENEFTGVQIKSFHYHANYNYGNGRGINLHTNTVKKEDNSGDVETFDR